MRGGDAHVRIRMRATHKTTGHPHPPTHPRPRQMPSHRTPSPHPVSDRSILAPRRTPRKPVCPPTVVPCLICQAEEPLRAGAADAIPVRTRYHLCVEGVRVQRYAHRRCCLLYGEFAEAGESATLEITMDAALAAHVRFGAERLRERNAARRARWNAIRLSVPTAD